MPQSKTPHLRFKGFSGEWESGKIGDYADIIAGGTPSTSNPTYWNPKQIPWMSSGEINKKRLFFTDNQISEIGLENSSAKWIKSNCVLIALAGQGKTRGTVAVNHIPLTTNQSIAAIVPNEKLYFEFLYQNLENRYDELRTQSSGDGSRGGLNKQIISQISIDFPEITEQTKIGDYFQRLDALIEQKEKKYQKLKQLKTAMLSQMFPKEGEHTPKLRFKGFSGEWKKREFKDNIISIQTGTNLLGATSNKGMPLIKMGNIQRGYFSFEKVEYLNENVEVEKENIANYGDFFFNTRNTLELVGKGATWMQSSGEFAFNSNIARFAFDGINTIFFNYLYNTQKMINQVHARAMGTTSVAAIYPKNLNSIEYYLPTLNEQTKIGNYFQKLDTLIDLHQKELEKLKNMKKALLAKMFV